MGTVFIVGEKFPLFDVSTKNPLLGQDGSVLEVLEGDMGFLFSIFFNSPSIEEVVGVRKETMQVRLFIEGEFALPLISFGDLIFEMSFDPTLYGDARALQTINKVNTLTVALIDSRNGMLFAIRYANFPIKLMQKCSDVWSRAFLIDNYSKRYELWYQGLRQYPMEMLWSKAEYMGDMGEMFDPEEVNYKRDSQHYKK